MAKVLRVLVILLFLLSIGAFMLGSMLFKKRELLKGRTQKLETTVLTLGKALEAQGPEKKEIIPDEYPAKDISPCKAEAIEKPETSQFWSKYKPELETLDIPTLNMETNRIELMNLYQLDPITGKVMRDPATGYPVTAGPGTMSYVLDDILVAKAREQYDRLNETRQTLKDIRLELVDTIKEFNKIKNDHRGSLVELEAVKAEIPKLEAKIEEANQKVTEVEEQKKVLEDDKNQIKADMAKLQEEAEEKDAQITQLKKEIELRGPASGPGPIHIGDAPVNLWIPQTGEKGKVVSVNPEWSFIIVELSDEFMAESAAAGGNGAVGIELNVKRLSQPEQFITKIRIVQVKPSQKLAIADILTNWQQLPVKVGDVLFH